MRRLGWIVLAIAIVLVAIVAAAAVLIVPPGDRDTAAAVVVGVAAAVQAMTAVVIVALTVRLVGASRSAQKASDDALKIAAEQTEVTRSSISVARDQLAIAERSDLHARRDRQLLAVPLVSAAYMSHSDFEGESILQVTVRNDGETPALDVHVVVDGRRDLRDQPDGYETRSARGETIQPGDEMQVSVSMSGFRAPDARPDVHDRPKGIWKYDFFAIRVEYRALLGQSVQIEYGWFAGHPVGWPDELWVVRRLHIELDVEGAEPVDLTF
jgi:hypothetical protein